MQSGSLFGSKPVSWPAPYHRCFLLLPRSEGAHQSLLRTELCWVWLRSLQDHRCERCHINSKAAQIRASNQCSRSLQKLMELPIPSPCSDIWDIFAGWCKWLHCTCSAFIFGFWSLQSFSTRTLVLSVQHPARWSVDISREQVTQHCALGTCFVRLFSLLGDEKTAV